MQALLSQRVKRMKESQTMKISGIAASMKKEGKPVISLSAGEPDFPTPEVASEAAIKAIQNNFTKYTINRGIPELRQAIARKLKTENDLHYTPEEIIVSNGGKHAIMNALLVLCNPGDEVIIPAPYWVSFPEMVSLVDATPVFINTSSKEKFKITPSQLDHVLSEKTKVLILNSPSNPTGTVYSEEEIKELMEVIRGKDIFVLSDEMYEQLIYGSTNHFSPARLSYMREKIVVSNAVSKTFSMTGWRIGYLAAPSWLINACNKIQSQMTSNACSISQKAAEAALKAGSRIVADMKTEFQSRRDFICQELNKAQGFEVSLPDGAFYIFPSVQNLIGKTIKNCTFYSSIDVAEFLLNHALVAVVPGEAFGVKGYLRLSYASSMSELKEAMYRIQKLFGSV